MRYRFFLYLGTFCFGFSPILVRAAGASGTVAAFYRVAVSATVLAVPFLVEQIQDEKRITRIGFLYALLGGIIFAINIAVFYTSLLLTSVANAGFLANTSVLWVGVATLVLLRNRLPPRFWLGTVISLAGVYLLGTKEGLFAFHLTLGDIVALSSGVFYACFILANQKGRLHLSALSYTWLSNLTGSLILLVVTQVLGESLFDFPLESYFALIALGIVSQVIGFWSITYAQGSVSPAETSVVLLLEPVVSLLLAFFLLGEQPVVTQLIGMGLLILGIYLASQVQTRQKPDCPS